MQQAGPSSERVSAQPAPTPLPQIARALKSERPSVSSTLMAMDGDKRHDDEQDPRGGNQRQSDGPSMEPHQTPATSSTEATDANAKSNSTIENIKDTVLALAPPSVLVEQVGNPELSLSPLRIAVLAPIPPANPRPAGHPLFRLSSPGGHSSSGIPETEIPPFRPPLRRCRPHDVRYAFTTVPQEPFSHHPNLASANYPYL